MNVSRSLQITTLCGIMLTMLDACLHADTPAAIKVPTLQREFRAAWVATVDNIDWPSKRGLPVSQQKAEIVAILNQAAKLHLNAIVLQVRPACDALYKSKLEPWSDYLTGEMGQAPEPKYDPLKMWVEEAHNRGIELHAWFNPYRAHHPSSKSAISADHISKTHPELTRAYGKHLWLDPGEKAVQDHSIRVILDVVKRYEIDGVHMDDYFYPYKEKDSSGNIIPFPDDPSWKSYVESGGALSRDDWRRDNVNKFVERLYKEVKSVKPWVKVGISPFGIWRPGNPSQIKGFDQYAELYADARKWLANGWVDYFAPQLYWKIDPPAQSYPVLLKWWEDQNAMHRHLWPGNYTSRVGESSSAWPATEIVRQIKATRAQPGAGGNIHFSMKTLMQNWAGLSDALIKGPYAQLALVPACPWLDEKCPSPPVVKVSRGSEPGTLRVAWKPAGRHPIVRWVVQMKWGDWGTQVVDGDQREIREIDGQHAAGLPSVIAVTAIDRYGNASPPAIVEYSERDTAE